MRASADLASGEPMLPETTASSDRAARHLAGLCTAAALAFAPMAQGALIDRGGGMIYDTDLDLTWLADANAGAGSEFDDGGNTTDGRMSWANATAWAASLTVGGVTGWRLPATADPDPTCTDAGGGQSSDPRGYTCVGAEMGHLHYLELGGASQTDSRLSGDPDLALFSNIQGDNYWSSTTEVGYPDYAWNFIFNGGAQNDSHKTTNFWYAWAVHDGDVAIPAPAAGWLFATALFGAIRAARRRRRG
jgi:hypothetical protein